MLLQHGLGVCNQIAELLRDHGVPVWHGPTNIRGGQHWHDEIGDALERCDWFVILLSPHSLKSVWVKRELIFALEEKRYDKSIVPVLISACNHRQLSWTYLRASSSISQKTLRRDAAPF